MDTIAPRSPRLAAVAIAALALGACSWGIKLDSGGRAVRVAWSGNVSGCKSLGEVSVSVTDRVGVYERNDLKVRDELEVLARNEAATLHADTIAPVTQPHGGEQRFGAYACGPARAADVREPARIRKPVQQGPVETYPLKDH